jgi:hypothetical protein
MSAWSAWGLAALAADPGNARYAGQCLSSGQLARIYGITDTDGSRPDCWSYVTEIQDAGLACARERLPVSGCGSEYLAATLGHAHSRPGWC